MRCHIRDPIGVGDTTIQCLGFNVLRILASGQTAPLIGTNERFKILFEQGWFSQEMRIAT